MRLRGLTLRLAGMIVTGMIGFLELHASKANPPVTNEVDHIGGEATVETIVPSDETVQNKRRWEHKDEKDRVREQIANEKLKDRIANADRLVVFEAVMQHAPALLTLSGDDAKTLIQAIGSARWISRAVNCGANYRIELYYETNQLLRISSCGAFFAMSLQEGQFFDESGVLEAFERRLRVDPLVHRAEMDDLATKVRQNVDIERLRAWCLARVSEYHGGCIEKRFLNAREMPGWFATSELDYWSQRAAVGAIHDDLQGRATCVVLGWGHTSGLIIGPTTGYEIELPEVSCVTNVAPGICAFHLREPAFE